MTISGDFCRLLITFANNFEPKWGPTECRSSSGSTLFGTLIVFLKDFLKTLIFEKKSSGDNNKKWKITQHAVKKVNIPRSGPTKGRSRSGSRPFDTLIVFLKDFLKTLILKKKSADDNKSMKNYPTCKEIFFDFSLSVKAAPHECVIRTGQP